MFRKWKEKREKKRKARQEAQLRDAVNQLVNFLKWSMVIISAMAVLVYGFSVSSFFFLLLLFILLPVKKVSALWQGWLGKYNTLLVRSVLYVLIFFIAVFLTPSDAATSEPSLSPPSFENGVIVGNENDSVELLDDIPAAVVTVSPMPTDTPTPAPTPTNMPTPSPEPTKAPVVEAVDFAPSGFDLSKIETYSGNPYVVVNDNEPFFSDSDMTSNSFESYSLLDNLNRCGVVLASIGKDIMPTEERGSIGSVKPSGWHTVKYDNVDGKYLYNRCHLIGYQLTGENANVNNLITGTRYLNIEGMLPFENMVADYVKETGNHVYYRVTPIFEGDNLLASGVLMEGKSVEDLGSGICFNVYCYNVQPDIIIDYATGESKSSIVATPSPSPTVAPTKAPAATKAPEVQESVSSAEMCWKSATGSKYHSINDCGNMNPNKAKYITVEQALSLNLEKCSKCY